MRIVHIVVGRVNPDSLNGVSKLVHWMATSQVQLGHDVEVWGLVTFIAPRSRPYTFRQFLMTKLRFTLARELRKALSQLEAGTWVQFHSVFVPEFPAISRELRKRGFAYGITPHGGYTAGDLRKNRWAKKVYLALRETRYLRKAAWIDATGAGEVEGILQLAPHSRVSLIPNGQIPLAFQSIAPRRHLERPVIGYCGRLSLQQKGLDLLIQGFAEYKAKGGPGELWLIGDGEDRQILEKLAERLEVAASMHFLGEKHGEEKLNLVGSLDAFIHSSRWEGMPTACLEAEALGKPLLISRETNLAEFVEQSNAGVVLDQTSAAGVALALYRVQTLYKDNQLDEIGNRARSLIEREFSWEANAKRFVATVSTCLTNR